MFYRHNKFFHEKDNILQIRTFLPIYKKIVIFFSGHIVLFKENYSEKYMGRGKKMSKVLFLNIPSHGHINPTLGLVEGLVKQGDEVLYFTTEEFRKKVESMGATFISYGSKSDFFVPKNKKPGKSILDDLLNRIDEVLNRADIIEYILKQIQGMKFDYIIYGSMFPYGNVISQILNIPAISSFAVFAKPKVFMEKGNEEFIKNHKATDTYQKLYMKLETLYGIQMPPMLDLFFNKGELNIAYTSELFVSNIKEEYDDKTFVADRISSDVALGYAYQSIMLNRLDTCLVCGTEAGVFPYGMSLFSSSDVLSKKRDACYCPYDLKRNGMILGEGAGTLVIEELEHALKRNAPIYGEILSFSNNCDGVHHKEKNKNGKKYKEVIESCIRKANISYDEIDYINLDGAALWEDDVIETNVLKEIWGKEIGTVSLSCPKSMFGNTFGAAGALDAIINCLAIKNNTVPPTINYEDQDSNCDLNYTPNKALHRNINTVLQIARGRGGINSAMLLREFKE